MASYPPTLLPREAMEPQDLSEVTLEEKLGNLDEDAVKVDEEEVEKVVKEEERGEGNARM